MTKERFFSILTIVLLTVSCIVPTTVIAPPPDGSTEAPQQNSTGELPPPVPDGKADVIFFDGEILTMDDSNPTAQAIAVQGNTILAVGAIEDVFAHRGEDTILIDLDGKTLVPGFTDSHSHRIMRGIDGLYDTKTTIDHSVAQGWTSLSEAYVPPDKMPKYLEYSAQDDIKLRVNLYIAHTGALGEPLGDWYKEYHQDQEFSPRWRVSGLKIFTGFGNDTTLIWTQQELNALLLARHREGWHLAIKTVSTETLEMILIALENLEKTDSNIVNRRVRLEHALFLTPEQIARVKRLGVVPSIQTNMPGELVGEQDIEELIARQPSGSAFPWRNLVEADIPIAGGSAFPTYMVTEPTGAPFGSPIRLIYQAVTRTGNLGVQPEPWMLDQTITAEDALRALTINAAYGNFQDDILGSLTPGKLADMVILSDNPLTVPSPEIKNIYVLMTMIDGKVEFCAPGYEPLCPTPSTQSIPAASTATPGLNLFTGTWSGPDLDDGSVITVSLTQTGNLLTGSFADTFSGSVNPGYAGQGSGSADSATTAQITFNMTRGDGKTASVAFRLTLSNQNNTLTLDCDAGCPITLQKQP